jgi:hypothetical protein
MIELFPDIPERTRTNAERAWRLAQTFHNPLTLANFLNEYTITAPSEEE